MTAPGPSRPRVILQAHATRSATALALLLHARDRGPREMRRPHAALVASFVVAVGIVAAMAIGNRVGLMLNR